MYLYLKKEELAKAEIKTKAEKGGWTGYYLFGEQIWDFELAPRWTIHTEFNELSQNKSIEKLFSSATDIVFPTYSSPRRHGIYQYGDATGKLIIGNNSDYCLQLSTNTWKGIEDMEILQNKLYAGDISPTICFDKEQKPMDLLKALKTAFKERKLSPVKRFILATRFATAK